LAKSGYRSIANEFETRLREALHRCDELSAAHLNDRPKPDKLRTAVCCRLLQELSQQAGPFSALLGTLNKELVRVCIVYPAWKIKE
jgi:hypothetical protein